MRHKVSHLILEYPSVVITMIIDLFADTAAILISIVLKDIMGCSVGKLICICPLGIP